VWKREEEKGRIERCSDFIGKTGRTLRESLKGLTIAPSKGEVNRIEAERKADVTIQVIPTWKWGIGRTNDCTHFHLE